ncbi:MAG: winged helix DNA-binding domain-containing protein [Candidatus Velamenicoccus archaeovorus]
MRTITTAERRARLAIRHALARPVGSVEEAARAVVGLHSSDPSSVYLSARARVEGFVAADLEAALYERRSLVRLLGMRRTLFIVPTDLAAAMNEACAAPLASRERRRVIRMLEEQGVVPPGAGARWLRRVADRTHAALLARGEATARELTEDVPELGAKLTFGEGTTWAATVGVSTRVLFLLAGEGRIVRTRPLGGWTSGQYRWAPLGSWLDAPLPRIDPAEARAELLRRWLRAFGPGTVTDLRWWTGWTAKDVAATLTDVGAEQVALDEGTGYVLPDDLEPEGPLGRWVALLPGLDATIMGWKERAWYLGPHGAAAFDRNGNAGPTVWADGRVVGGWAQAADGEVVVELLEPVDARTRRAIEEERERLRTWLGDVRIKTRFPSPLEARLARRTTLAGVGAARRSRTASPRGRRA